MLTRTAFLASALVALGCSDEAVAPPITTGGGGALPLACDAHASAGPASFRDATSDWALGPLTGSTASQTLAAADVDGDGYPDLVVHGYGGRMAVDAEVPFVRLLVNEAKPGGGRHFVDRTADSGYPGLAEGSDSEHRAAHMAALGDIDNDGDLDLVSGTYNDPFAPSAVDPAYAIDRSLLFLNDGQGHFAPAPVSALQAKMPAAVAGLSLADVNRDGRLDLFQAVWFTRTGGESIQPLLLGNGDGTFSDVTADFGLGGVRRPGFGATACDVDDNGVVDLLTQSYGRRPNLLFVGDGEGTYYEVGVATGYAYDDDHSYDDDQSFLCWCAQNPSDARCAEAASPSVNCAGVPVWSWGNSDAPENLGGNSFSSVCGDVDNDGLLDVYTGEIAHWWAGEGSDRSNLLYTRRDAAGIHFERQDRAALGLDWVHAGPSWDEGGLYTSMADFDNDGRLDILVGASDYDVQWGMIFHQQPDGTFRELAQASGFVHPCPSSPVVADFDRDGDLDIVAGGSLWRPFCNEAWGGDADTAGVPEIRLYESDASTKGAFFAVRLVGDGVTANTTGIGARVVVDAGGVRQTRELGAGHGHFSMQDDTVLFFGVGDCAMAASVEVTWPDAARTVQRFENVPLGRLVEIHQGSDAISEP